MPSNDSISATISLCLIATVRDDSSCPSLASDASSQRSGSIEPANTACEPGSPVELRSGSQLHILDRVSVWSRWLEVEPNPVFEPDEFHRGQYLRGLEGAIASLFFCIQSPGKIENFETAGGEDINCHEPTDSALGKRRIRKGQTSSKTGNTPRRCSKKATLSKDITDPKGSDKEELLLGFGTYNAKNETWCFKCYWFKRHPSLHSECCPTDMELERSVRTSHAQWHKDRGDIMSDTLDRLANLASCVGTDVTRLRGREREIAMWQEGYVVVFPEHRVVKHLLNPTIGPLFHDAQEADALLAAANSPMDDRTPAQPARLLHHSLQDNSTSLSTSRSNVSLTDTRASSSSVAQSLAVPSSSRELMPVNGLQLPITQTSHTTPPFVPVYVAELQSGHQIMAIPTQFIQVVETVEHAWGLNRAVLPLTIPIDPQLTSTATSVAPFTFGSQQANSRSPELPPQPNNRAYTTPQPQGRGWLHTHPDSGQETMNITQRFPNLQLPNRVQAAYPLPASLHETPPSLTTDSTYTSGIPGGTTPSETTTPPKIDDDALIGQATLILPEATRQDMGSIEPEIQEVSSPDILSSPFKMPDSGNVMFGSFP